MREHKSAPSQRARHQGREAHTIRVIDCLSLPAFRALGRETLILRSGEPFSFGVLINWARQQTKRVKFGKYHRLPSRAMSGFVPMGRLY